MRYTKSYFKSREEDRSYLVAKEDPFSYTTENLHKAIINLEYANIDNKYKVIQFTSSQGNEGKTTISANIAYLLSQRNIKVLLMDLDLRKPKVHRIFDVPNENGLNDYLIDNIDIEKLIKKSELGFDYINSGEETSSVINIITSDKVKTLLESLRESYDYILIDSPPVFPVSDSLYIANIVDGIIFVVAQNKVNKKGVKESFSALSKSKDKIIGSIMTQVKVRSNNTRYYYGNKE